MRNKLLLVLSICTVFLMPKAGAQNMVLNPSFENTSSCPTGISQLQLCTSWSTTNSGSDSCTTPDLYAACASTLGGCNVPNALLGYQQARTGSHFAGIILGDGSGNCLVGTDNYREYIEGQLSSPLVASQQYTVTFYVSLADQTMWGTTDIGVYFSNSLYLHDACVQTLIPVTPQLNYCGAGIMDTDNWVPVTWLYTATGGEQYFTIGNFKNDASTNHITHNCSSTNPYIYYYIDDVSVSSTVSGECAFAIETSTQSASCVGGDGVAQVEANGCTGPFKYLWGTGDTTSSISHLRGGSYLVTVTDALQCSVTSALMVDSGVLRLSLSAVNPSSCDTSDGSIMASATGGTGILTYSWNTGDTLPGISGLLAGYYSLTVSNGTGCSGTAAASLSSSLGLFNITLQVTTTPDECNSGSGSATAVVSGGIGGTIYHWSDSSTAASINNLHAGRYQLTVSDITGCSTYASAVVNSLDVLTLSAITTNTGCSNNDGTISLVVASGTGPFSYTWSTHDSTATITGLQQGAYTVTVTDSSTCSASATYVVQQPSGATPNQSICMVTADSTGTQNIVVWEKADKYATDSFFIYRANYADSTYLQIAAVPRDSLSEYDDVDAHPDQRSYRYKMNLLDTCGHYSALSNYHQTIYLWYLNSGTFNFIPYVIENGLNPIISYDLYRDSLGSGDWEYLTSVPGSQNFVSDPTYAQYPSARYVLYAVLSHSCTPSRSVTYIRSNIVSHLVTSISSNTPNEIRLLPNPTRDKFEVVNNNTFDNIKSVALFDQLAKKLMAPYQVKAGGSISVDISEFASGVYYLLLNYESGGAVLKIVKY